ncbi:unnamed protein product [Ilex paraguariensis]|uniref:Uncharacterized protein n=1 Tax=Ilex paraguariensis TaxID=185542 RepID=A0ABC8V359_9AQUA
MFMALSISVWTLSSMAAEGTFKLIGKALEVLSDPETRKSHDFRRGKHQSYEPNTTEKAQSSSANPPRTSFDEEDRFSQATPNPTLYNE